MIVVGEGMSAPKGHLWVSAESAMAQAASWLPLLIAVCVAGIAMGAVVRHVMAARVLKERDRFDVLPTSDFDPSPEEILRYCFQLARTRPAVSLMTPRSAQGVRIRLSTESGLLGYSVSGPRRASSVLEQAGYGEVEVRRREWGQDA